MAKVWDKNRSTFLLLIFHTKPADAAKKQNTLNQTPNNTVVVCNSLNTWWLLF